MGLLLWPTEAAAQTCSPPQNVSISPNSGVTQTYGCYNYVGYSSYYAPPFVVGATGTKPMTVRLRVRAPRGGYVYPSYGRTRTMYGSSVSFTGYSGYFYMRRARCGPASVAGRFSVTAEVSNRCGRTTRQTFYDMDDPFPPRLYNRSAPCHNVYSATDPNHYGNRAYDNCGSYYYGETWSRFIPPETKTDGRCLGIYTLHRTFDVGDCNGNTGRVNQNVYVYDYYPPVVVPGSGNECVWPPNHSLVSFTEAEFPFTAYDVCGIVASKQLTSCSSNECDESNGEFGEVIGCCQGDGNQPNDCQMLPDGSLGVRAERCGDGDGRTYDVEGRATDDCGNTSPPSLVGTVDVPHDTDDQHTWEMECISAE
jgi:hypothetical protein